MAPLGKLLIVIGLGCLAAGLLVMALGRIPWLGRLPGDIYIRRGNLSFYFPLATCIVISIALSLLLMLFKR